MTKALRESSSRFDMNVKVVGLRRSMVGIEWIHGGYYKGRHENFRRKSIRGKTHSQVLVYLKRQLPALETLVLAHSHHFHQIGHPFSLQHLRLLYGRDTVTEYHWPYIPNIYIYIYINMRERVRVDIIIINNTHGRTRTEYGRRRSKNDERENGVRGLWPFVLHSSKCTKLIWFSDDDHCLVGNGRNAGEYTSAFKASAVYKYVRAMSGGG